MKHCSLEWLIRCTCRWVVFMRGQLILSCAQQWEARREQLKTREEEASAARASQNKYLEDGGRGPDAGGGDSTGGTGGGAESGKASAEAEATSYNINEQ